MKKTFLSIFFVLVCLTSCTSLSLAYLGANRKTVNLSVYHNHADVRTIVFVPMVHIGKPAFYEDVSKKLDSLRHEGYVVFYEGVGFDADKYSPEELDTLKRKIRKYFGFNFTKSGYGDAHNPNLPKAFFNDKYVAQTKLNIGIKSEDINVDIPLDSLIEMFEKKEGEIQLTPCDFNTPFTAEYDCETVDVWSYTISTYRDDFIGKKTIDSPHDKIALVYGKNHFIYAIGGIIQKNGFSKVKN